MAEKPIGPGTVLAGRFRLEDLLQESRGAKFWRASDMTLARNVAVHVVGGDDSRAPALLAAARASATVSDGHILRVLDAAEELGVAYVVNEWGSGMSLDRMLADGPLSPRRAAWVAKEVADALNTAHRSGVAHGRLIPENVMVSEAGAVKLIGFAVDGALNGREGGNGFADQASDVTHLAALLYAALVAKWPGTEASSVPSAPREHGRPLRPRQVRAGIPRPLDAICDRVLNPDQPHRHVVPIETAHEVAAALSDFIGDPGGNGAVDHEHTMVLSPVRRLGDRLAGFPAGQQHEEPTLAWQTAPEQRNLPHTGAATSADTAADLSADTAADTGSNRGDHPGADRGAEETSGGSTPHHPDPEATQAGVPVFFDEDSGVGWISPGESRGLGLGEPRRTPPPPPPPLPEPEPKPLFAPDPPGGRPRPGWDPAQQAGQQTGQQTGQARQSVGPDPYATDAQHAYRRPSGYPDVGFSTSGGTGSLPPVWGPDADQPPPEDTGEWDAQKAGRGWLRLGAAIVGFLVLVFAVVIAFNFGRGPGPAANPVDHSSASQRPSSSPGKVLDIAGVRDFDPEASPPEENPQMAPLAVDGDPSTAWQTMTYYGNPKLGGLKDGVGLVVDLGSREQVSQVRLLLQGKPTSLQILSAGSSTSFPTGLSGLTKVASAEHAGTHVTLTLKHPVRTEFLVVWLTSLPRAQGGYQGRVAEIQVRS